MVDSDNRLGWMGSKGASGAGARARKKRPQPRAGVPREVRGTGASRFDSDGSARIIHSDKLAQSPAGIPPAVRAGVAL